MSMNRNAENHTSDSLDHLHDRDGFDSATDVRQFEDSITKLLAAEVIEEIEHELTSPMDFGERWFRDKKSGATFRYVPPEFPARGRWEKIR